MIVRWLLLIIGCIAVGLAVLGLLLPGLPAFPFVLLATACFSRSSPRFNQWLLSHRVFGPIILNWRESRSMSRKTKLIAISSIVLGGGYSVAFVIESFVWKILLVATLLIPILIITRLPTTEDILVARDDTPSE